MGWQLACIIPRGTWPVLLQTLYFSCAAALSVPHFPVTRFSRGREMFRNLRNIFLADYTSKIIQNVDYFDKGKCKKFEDAEKY